MSKDKIYGFGIFLITILLLIFYTLWVPIQMLVDDEAFGLLKNDWDGAGNLDFTNPLVGLMLPVYFGSLLFGFIIAWIGFTMATTPPPEPIDLEELDLEEKPEGE